MDKAAKMAGFEALLAEKLKLHSWAGEWQDGGLSDDMLRALFELSCTVTADNAGVILETGAGLSTLMFLASGPSRLITVAPNSDLRDRIYAQIARFSLADQQLDFRLGRSEDVLPDLAKSDVPYVDLALIDGGHGMPTTTAAEVEDYHKRILKWYDDHLKGDLKKKAEEQKAEQPAQ